MMRNIETFPSKQMYPYLSLVERKVAEFYHNINRRHWLVWSKWLIFITFPDNWWCLDVDWNGFTRIFIKELKLKRKINVKWKSPAAWESKRKKMTGFKLLPVDILSFDHFKELRTWELLISCILTTSKNLELWNYWHLVFWPLLRT